MNCEESIITHKTADGSDGDVGDAGNDGEYGDDGSDGGGDVEVVCSRLD